MSDDSREQLFKSWLEEHRGILVKVASAFTAEGADREDLIQEMLVRLWKALPSFRGDSRPSTWIYRVALNRAITWRREESRRRGSLVPLVEAIDYRQPSSPDAQRLERVYAELRQLDEVDRSLLLMSLDRCSYREMAEVMGMTESNVGVRLSRAKGRLAERLREESDD